jgi:hypothetical protein
MVANAFFRWALLMIFGLLLFPQSGLHAEPCPTFYLRNDHGEIIDPINGRNDLQPYSPKQTCGVCHDYNLISKGYHFDMDWNLADDTFSIDSAEPWKISDGMGGGYCTVPFRQLARKSNMFPDAIDLTPFDFAASGPSETAALDQPGCGGCHPGGGLMEKDRNGRRYDIRLAEDPELAARPDGDYYRSQWDKSGVVEVDCFFCHLEGYNAKNRNIQLKRLNFKWATVAASGIGQVDGAVKEGQAPRIVYNKRLFNEDGRIVLAIRRKPAAENCLLCHGSIDLAKRGTTWDDAENPDVHQLAGLTCIDCHFGNIEHNFAKGDSLKSHVRDDLDNSMRGCEDCHTQGYKGAPIPKHYSIRNNHLDKLACTACHIPELNRGAIGAMVMSAGPAVKYPQFKAAQIGAKFKWEPGYVMRQRKNDSQAKIYPVNLVDSILFCNEDLDGKYYPLFEKEISEAFIKTFGSSASADAGLLYFQSYDNIAKMLSTLSETLAGDRRFSRIKPSFHMGGQICNLDAQGKLTAQKDTTWVGRKLCFSISHNVLPSQKALGAGGCSDCHSTESHLFNGAIVTQRFGVSGKLKISKEAPPQQVQSNGLPLTTPSAELLGFSSTTRSLNAFFEYNLTRILPLLFIGFVSVAIYLKFRFVHKKAVLYDEDHGIFRHAGHAKQVLMRKALIRTVVLLLLLVGAAHLLVFVNTGMLSLFVSLYKKITTYSGGAAIFLFLLTAAAYYSMLSRFQPPMLGGGRTLIRLTHLMALVMLITGLLLLMKNEFSVTINLLVSSIHSAVAVTFLSAVYCCALHTTAKMRSEEG